MLSPDLSDDAAMEDLRRIQHEVLVAAAGGDDLEPVLELLCRRVEAFAPEAICSIIGVDNDGRLRSLAAPSLPGAYSRSIDGVPVGPDAGSCGTAVFRGEPVEVTDIATDPLWEPFKAPALALGLRACWSSPILAPDRRVIGSFAFYFRECRGPTARERLAVEVCVHLCAIVVEQHASRQEVHRLAYYDQVTGLPNRVLFRRRLEAAIRDAGVCERLVVVLLNLDGFKGVNESFGHATGDALLRSVGERLSQALREGEFVARYGSDEFVAVQRAPADGPGQAEFASRLFAALDGLTLVEGQLLPVSACCGIATSVTAGDFDTFIQQADLALHTAKRDGSGTRQVFEPSMLEQVLSQRAMELDLRRALEAGEFDVVYQPVYDIATNQMAGAEALVRWNHPRRGVVSPAEFIPVAEQSGLIGRIGDLVLARAARDAADWPPHLFVAVNLSARQFKSPGFARHVISIARRGGLPLHRLEVEITETALMGDPDLVKAALQQLRRAGAAIALDDFGTGYSSLSHVRMFPIDKIKIDRSFVTDFGAARAPTAIVSAVLRLAGELGMTTTAEGIETMGQLQKLRSAGCTQAQGFLLGRPQPLAELRELMVEDRGAVRRLAEAAPRRRRARGA